MFARAVLDRPWSASGAAGPAPGQAPAPRRQLGRVLVVLVAGAWMTAACSDDPASPPVAPDAGGGDATSSDRSPVDGDTPDSGTGADAGSADAAPLPAPVFTGTASITRSPRPAAPLSVIIGFTADVPVRARYTITEGARTWSVRFTELAEEHHDLLLGFRAGRSHGISLQIEDAAGQVTSSTVSFTFDAPSLPIDKPPIDVLVASDPRAEPGYRLLTARRRTTGPGLANYLLAFDADGEVVWYYRTFTGIVDFERLPSGNILIGRGDTGASELDLLGTELIRWRAAARLTPDEDEIPIATDSLHHEVSAMPDGSYLALSTEVRTFEGYVSPRGGTETATVVGDVIIQYERDGSLTGEWKMLDLLDPYRLAYDSLGAFWNWLYDTPTRDWTHGNSVDWDPRDDTFIVSLRHQDAVVKLRRTGELVWILAPNANWQEPWESHLLQLTGNLEPNYHQHAAHLLPNGNLMIFDNGNNRASPPDARRPARQNYSRVVELEIDEVAGTATEVWVYGGPGQETFYSPYVGNADVLPVTGNVLVADGGRISDLDGLASDDIGGGHAWGRVVEVTHTSPPEKVFEIVIDDRSPRDPAGWVIYRAQHFPTLYGPSVVLEER